MQFTIIEFDPDTFQLLIEYLHSGACPLTCDTVPGLICAAEHFDLPDLLQACFHHTKTHLRLSVVPKMLNQLENYYWRYNSASQLVNTIYKFVDPRAHKLFARGEFLTLSESILTAILTRSSLNLSESRKFQVMLLWSLGKLDEDAAALLSSTTSGAGGLKNASRVLAELERLGTSETSDHKMTELRALMSRLTRDLKLHKIPPQELIKVSRFAPTVLARALLRKRSNWIKLILSSFSFLPFL